MFESPRTKQLLWLVMAAIFLVSAGMIHGPINKQREEYELVPPGDVVARNYPGYTLLTMAPGGLRAPIINYLWIRADALKDAGRHYEAMQLAELICHLMPRFPGVWHFHAWNMAWNISVTTHTPDERWLWVYNGIKLLRDKGIPLNPKALGLYKELGWIFFFKMGQTMDDMHWTYKQRWASQMQHLLAAPAYAETKTVIDFFRPIADAPLDKDPRRQGGQTIQADQLKVLMEDAEVARYANLLARHGVHVGEPLLDAYNRFSRDDSVEIVRVEVPKLNSESDRKISELVNDPQYADQRNKLLAFVRAQILWNVYKMDPDWMLHLMTKYNAPLDWRMVQPHGLYWVTYGIEYCGSVERGDVQALNIDRIVMNSLKILTWNGRLTYTENPRQENAPSLQWISDWRLIKPTHEAHIAFGKAVSKTRQKQFNKNIFRDGHVNFLIKAIGMLYAAGRRSQAEYYFDWIKDNYHRSGGIWDLSLDEFVIERLNEGGRPIPDLARSQLQAALLAAYENAAAGNAAGYRRSIGYARRVYNIYQKGAPKRNLLPSFRNIRRNVLSIILVRPQTLGIYLSLQARHRLYASSDPQMQIMLYDRIAPMLKKQCDEARIKLDFNKAFPAPEGIEEYRAIQRRKLVAPK